jgi:transposase
LQTKAQAVCRLCLSDLPADTMLFSVDEKTCMQARSRKRATRPVRPGQPERREFEYRRHGTVSLMAAMNVTTGTVHPKIITRNDSDTFIEFLTELAETVEPTRKIHLILDNGSSHTSKQTKKWLSEHPRFTVTYTPCHASWLNMIEIFFSIMTRRILRRGDFPSRDDLIEKITTFIQTYNRTAKPFRWTYDAKLLRAA